MQLKTFEELCIGDRFKALTATSVIVLTKTRSESGTDQYGERIYNASLYTGGQTAFQSEDVIMKLTDEEVVEAVKIQDHYRLGKALKDSFILYQPTGDLYVKCRVLQPKVDFAV